MSESNPWGWFHDLVKHSVAPALAQFDFTGHTFGAPGDDNWEWQGGMVFRSPASIQVEVDALDKTEAGNYFLIKCHMYRTKMLHLKYFLYPQIYEQTRDAELWQGWKCYNEDDVRAALTEIADGLRAYFTEYPPST